MSLLSHDGPVTLNDGGRRDGVVDPRRPHREQPSAAGLDRLHQAVEPADIEVGPALAAAAGDADDGRDEHAALGDEEAAWFRREVGWTVRQARDGAVHGVADRADVGHRIGVGRRHAAADVQHLDADPVLLEAPHHQAASLDRPGVHRRVRALRADVEGQAVGAEAELGRHAQEPDGLVGRRAELA